MESKSQLSGDLNGKVADDFRRNKLKGVPNGEYRSVGIVSEFNPFHKGHRYLIDSCKTQLDANVVVSVMSGNFTQRGEPAVFNKWDRAKLAINNGVDLVVQIPTIYASASADYFSKGAVEVLEGLGGIEYLAFGSESGNGKALAQMANLLVMNEDEIEGEIKDLLKKGMTYPAARERAITSLYGDELEGDYKSLIAEPNNILAIEYLMNVKTMKPFTVKRAYGGHHQSASEIRREMAESDGKRLSEMEDRYFQLLKYKILSSSSDFLESLGSAGQGLGNKLKKEIRYANNRNELIERVKSKAYTHTRINRLLAQSVLGITKSDFDDSSPYIKVLGSNDVGRKYLKYLKKNDLIKIPVIESVNKAIFENPKLARLLELDVLESDIYNLISGADSYENSEFVRRGFLGK